MSLVKIAVRIPYLRHKQILERYGEEAADHFLNCFEKVSQKPFHQAIALANAEFNKVERKPVLKQIIKKEIPKPKQGQLFDPEEYSIIKRRW